MISPLSVQMVVLLFSVGKHEFGELVENLFENFLKS